MLDGSILDLPLVGAFVGDISPSERTVTVEIPDGLPRRPKR